MIGIAEKIVAIDRALSDAGIDHAFGGALALAWCTRVPRGTSDIDVNIFSEPESARTVFSALPPEISWSDAEIERARADGQVRLLWDRTPVDVFLSTTEFHSQVATRTHFEQFGGAAVPFLSCTDLAVFKAFFNRTRDWADLEDMMDLGSLDIDRVIGILVRYLGPADQRVERLRSLGSRPS